MNKNPGVHGVLELLDRFKRSAAGFATREDRVQAEFAAKSSAARKASAYAETQLATRVSASLANLEADFQSQQAQCQARFERLRVRTGQAGRSSLRKELERIELEEGRVKYETQKSMLEADRRRESELANADSGFKKLQERLESLGTGCEAMEEAARKAFRGYPGFLRLLSVAPESAGDASSDPSATVEALELLMEKTKDGLARFSMRLTPRFFRQLPAWMLLVLLVLAHAALPSILHRFGIVSFDYREAGISLAALTVLLLGVYILGGRQAGSEARAIAADIVRARQCRESGLANARASLHARQEQIRAEFETVRVRMDAQWQTALQEAAEKRARSPKQADDRVLSALQRLEKNLTQKLDKLRLQHEQSAASLRQEAEALQQERNVSHESDLAMLAAEHQSALRLLETEWKDVITPVWESLNKISSLAGGLFPEWGHFDCNRWTPPDEFRNMVKFGELTVGCEQFIGRKWENRVLKLPCPPVFSAPLLLAYPCQGSVLFETTEADTEEVVETVNNVIYRLLAATPPGKLAFTIIDPVGLGQSFAGLMHLSDYSQTSISGRIWTQAAQIEEKLAELNEHMEKVIQMYLRNEYATIAEYNAQAGVVAEKYHILVIAGFPVNFSDAAARRLLNIAANGPRCGVYMLAHWDRRHALPHDFVPDELQKNNVRIVGGEHGFALANWDVAGIRMTLDRAPSPETALSFLHKVGASMGDFNRVEVPFLQVAPSEREIWTEDTAKELRVPIGRSGATKLQYLALGRGTCQHALIAGKTGSGKSTLFHVIVANLALWCAPDQVEFYLVDFKKGVEFKCYATRRLPHARVVAIESDREFGVSVLQRVDDELRRRGTLFRKFGVQDISGFKSAGGAEPMPRCLLIIDEFQEFFVEDDKLSQTAAVLLDRIVRQGRAFGIHALLGSQTLGGAYTLARATIGQMTVRIALQCNEADAYMIMDESNAAPRLLSRPGEGIYNDTAGTVQGNSPFQAVWLSESERDDVLLRVQEMAAKKNPQAPTPIVFEGNAPADIRDNLVLRAALESQPPVPAASARIWLGAPNSVKGPTEAVFHRQSGNNLLIVGQREESALAILSIAIVSVLSQNPPGAVRIVLFDSSPPGSAHRDFIDQVERALPMRIERPKAGDLGAVLSALADDIKDLADDDAGTGRLVTLLVFHGIENYKKLRQEDDFSFSTSSDNSEVNPAALLGRIIDDGPGKGIHVVASCDTYGNAMRYLGRKLIAAMSMRVLFQMSANDSSSLIDSPDAGSLGLHRALFYNEQEGYRETFRPYALPGIDWFEEAGRKASAKGSSC